MPVYNYHCHVCCIEYSDLQKSSDDLSPCPQCERKNESQLPTGGHTVVYETGDKNRNKQVKKNVQKELRERMVNHHDNYELQEKIDRYGYNEAKRHGWLKRVKKV